MCVQLSWDGGMTWTAAQSTPTLSTSEARYLLGGPTNTWGRTWNAGEFSNGTFRVRVSNVASSKNRDFFLDWISVRVHYQGWPVVNYLYDPLDRLTQANYESGDYFHYRYDAVGNRLAETTSAGTTTYEYDIANRLASVNGVTFTWDNNGNLTSDGVNTYTYDHANRLTGVTGTGLSANYEYNGLGDRLRQVVEGQTTDFVMDLNSGLSQVLTDGTNSYLYGHARLGQESVSGMEYYLSDALGSVRQLADVSGVTLSRAYEPYGEVQDSSGSGMSSYGFTGEWTDSQTGLVYLRARHYAPGFGRFVSSDIWQGDELLPISYNQWVYGYGNPINYIDPTGMIGIFPRPFGVCSNPPSSKSNPLAKTFLYTNNKMAIYCGEFKLTGYQFVVDRGYVSNLLVHGNKLDLRLDFARDVQMNGTGKTDAGRGVCKDGYLRSVNINYDPDRDFYSFTYKCGKAKQFNPTKDFGKVAAADLGIFDIDSDLYLPGMCSNANPGRGCNLADYNPYVTVRDTGGGILGYHLDIFTGEGPGLLSTNYSQSPVALWLKNHSYLGVTKLDSRPSQDALGPTTVYQFLTNKHLEFYFDYWGCK